MAETDDRYRQSSNSKGEGKNRNMDTGSSNTSQRPETTTRASQSFRQASSKEHPGLSRQNHSTLGNALPHNAHSKNPLRRPHYSLAGNTASQTHSPSYVDPKYYELNPRYRKGETEPVWGLAKPLPRVVRPGMRKGRQQGEEVVEDKNAEREEPGGSEPIPQVGMVGDQRAEAGMERIDDEASENRGYGHQREEMRRQTSYRRGSRYGRGQVQSRDTARRVASAVSITERMGTPKDEKSDPIDELGATLPSQSSNTNPFEDNKTPSRRLVSTSTVAFDFASPTNDDYDLDLEAGENIDDWSLEKDEAEHYIQEERDTFNRWASIRAKFREPLAECLAVSLLPLLVTFTDTNSDNGSSTHRYSSQSRCPNLQQHIRGLSVHKLGMGPRGDDWRIYCRRNFGRSSQPRNFAHALDLPRISLPQGSHVYHCSARGSFPGRTNCIRRV